jgi:UrcA family protein
MNTATHLAPASCLKANIRTTALFALGVLASAAAVAGPQTDTAPVTRSAKVSLAGIDLSTPEGARTARERLRETARRLCTQVADNLDLSHQANFVACVDATLAAALLKATEFGASTASAKAAQAGGVAARSDQARVEESLVQEQIATPSLVAEAPAVPASPASHP